MSATFILNSVLVVLLGNSISRFICIFLGVPFTEISRLKVLRGEAIWLSLLLGLGLSQLELLKIGIITGLIQSVSDLSKIELSLSCVSFLRHNIFSLLSHFILLHPQKSHYKGGLLWGSLLAK